ncbi:MAG TPA: LamG domain-containing protein, partial [Planctomycetota bacterium]|nr:LamG domain-containing protein [Planctomycetota bacterium]
DTWEWNGTDWTQLTPNNYPSKRNQHKMVYDSARQRIVLFAGATEAGTSNETWEYGDAPLTNYTPATTPGPIAWWKFDETSGTTAGDSSGNGNNGMVYGATWNSNTLSFDGINDCVKVTDSPVLKPSRITVEAWIKPKRISQTVLLEKVPSGVYPPQKGWQIFINTITEPKNTIVAWIGNGAEGKTGFLGETVIQAETWYHIAMTYDGASLNLYVNGILDGSKPHTAGIGDNSAASLAVGYSEYWNSNYFNGLIKDAKIYDYARSAAQIQADYDMTHH